MSGNGKCLSADDPNRGSDHGIAEELEQLGVLDLLATPLSVEKQRELFEHLGEVTSGGDVSEEK